MISFQLTRSVGSVTHRYTVSAVYPKQFQLTRSVGSVTDKKEKGFKKMEISTHTLRGERDITNTTER